jgi:predicted HD superfamily hydrolase involved in NAD metabolism
MKTQPETCTPAGAELAAELFGITDSDILNAVRYHTIGRAQMSLLEKIIYLADLTSADRHFDEVEQLREMVDKDLDETMLLFAGIYCPRPAVPRAKAFAGYPRGISIFIRDKK